MPSHFKNFYQSVAVGCNYNCFGFSTVLNLQV